VLEGSVVSGRPRVDLLVKAYEATAFVQVFLDRIHTFSTSAEVTRLPL